MRLNRLPMSVLDHRLRLKWLKNFFSPNLSQKMQRLISWMSYLTSSSTQSSLMNWRLKSCIWTTNTSWVKSRMKSANFSWGSNTYKLPIYRSSKTYKDKEMTSKWVCVLWLTNKSLVLLKRKPQSYSKSTEGTKCLYYKCVKHTKMKSSV